MKNYTLYFLLFIGVNVYAEVPTGYYDSAEGKMESALKTALYNIIDGHTDKGYDFLYTIYETSDNTSTGKVWDMYSTCDWYHDQKTCGNYSTVCDCYNREHSIPQSWFSSKSPMKNDAFHVYPTDGRVNGQRGNNPFGECNNGATLSSKALGKLGSSTFTGYSGTVFEPVDEYKGDFARTYFYFATRYQNIMTSIGGASFNGTTYPALSSWAVNLFLKWHRQDPVSQKEIDRNNAIYYYQKNRNPFIDHPELAEYIWGDKKDVAWTSNVGTSPQVLTPSKNSTIDFGKIPYNQNSSLIVSLKAANLTDNISLSLSGTNSSQFSLSPVTISKSNAESGTTFVISCNPQNLGEITTQLIISGGGLDNHTVTIKASSSDSFIALDATNMSSSTFTANWTSSVGATGYKLDVYSYQVSGSQSETLFEETFNSGLPGTWTKTGYSTDSEETGAVRMASGSQNCSLTTPSIDLSQSSVLMLRAKQYSNDNGAPIEVYVDETLVETITTEKAYKTFAITLPAATDESTLTFSVTKGKRVYIDNVKVATEEAITTLLTLPGYPKSVGNVLSYTVSDLYPDSTYYYTVTPEGNGALESNEIRVKTTSPTQIENPRELPDIIAYYSDRTLYISNIEAGSTITIFTVLGTKVFETKTTTDQLSIPFDGKGIHIIQATKDRRVTGSRKMILR